MTVNPTAYRDAETTNDSERSGQIFKDINLSFAKILPLAILHFLLTLRQSNVVFAIW